MHPCDLSSVRANLFCCRATGDKAKELLVASSRRRLHLLGNKQHVARRSSLLTLCSSLLFMQINMLWYVESSSLIWQKLAACVFAHFFGRSKLNNDIIRV